MDVATPARGIFAGHRVGPVGLEPTTRGLANEADRFFASNGEASRDLQVCPDGSRDACHGPP